LVAITLLDAAILDFLYTEGYKSKINPVKQTDIALDIKQISLYKRLTVLRGAGLIEQGLLNGHAYTYYITPKGIDFYLEVVDA